MGEWKSVTEELPPDRKGVLGWAPKHLNIFAVELKDGIWCEWCTGFTQEYPEDAYGPITHWMEMPEPPCEDDGCDNVNHPSHYSMGGIECIDGIKAALGENYIGFLIGNVIKYCWRYKYKNGLEDIKKARYYLEKAIGELENDDGK